MTRCHLPLALAVAFALAGCDDGSTILDAGPAPDGAPPAGRDMRVPDTGGPDDGPAADLGADAADPDAADPDAALGPACGNGRDDDDDGLVDLADPGCEGLDDDDEADPATPPACANGVDDDDDGLVDWPDDPDCASAGGDEGGVCGALNITALTAGETTPLRLFRRPAATEASCQIGASEAAVGTLAVEGPAIVRAHVESPRPVVLFARDRCRDRLGERACLSTPGVGDIELEVDGDQTVYILVQPLAMLEAAALDVELTVEVVPVPDTCRNGLDDDGDGRIDQADPGCSGPDDADETDPDPLPECANGIDDDGDGATDWPDDPECAAASGLREGLACGGVAADLIGLGEHRLHYVFDSAVDGVTRGQCGGQGDEAVAVIAIDRPATLVAEITTPVAGNIATYLRADCRDRSYEAVCDAAFSERRIVVDRLEPGTWFLFFDHDVGFEQRVDEVDAHITLTALPRRACENAADDDGDGLVDLADPGCARPGDDDETDPAVTPTCADGLDNDGDGAIDYPLDLDCPAAGSAFEGSDCVRGAPVIPVDDAGGTFVVDARPLARSTAIADCEGDLGAETVFAVTLESAADLAVTLDAPQHANARVWLRAVCDDFESERACGERQIAVDGIAPGTWYVFVELGEAIRADEPPTVRFDISSLIGACNDRIDNDGDGLVDLADPGCAHGRGPSEVDPAEPPECADGLDNDGDGLTDYPDDPECSAAGADSEVDDCRPGAVVVDLEEIEAGGEAELFGVAADGVGGAVICGMVTRSDEVTRRLVIGERSRVTAEAIEGAADVSIRRQCGSPESEVACGEGFRALQADLDAGVYYLLAASTNGGPAQVLVTVESLIVACNDEVDNDGDGLVDAADPGCAAALDPDEADPDPLPACADGVDNDDDGFTDHPDDPECLFAGFDREDDLCVGVDDEIMIPAEGGRFEIDTRGRARHFDASCGRDGAAGGDAVLVLPLAERSQVTVEVDEGTFDTLLHIRPSCDPDVEDIACNDDGGEGNLSRIVAELDAGLWVIVLDGYNDATGTATVDVTVVGRGGDAEAP